VIAQIKSWPEDNDHRRGKTYIFKKQIQAKEGGEGVTLKQHLSAGMAAQTHLYVVSIHNGILCSHEEERNVIIRW
jgi:hypothetical protein